MKLPTILTLLGFACLTAVSAAPSPAVPKDRLDRAYAEITNGLQSIQGLPVQRAQDLTSQATSMPPDAVRQASLKRTMQIQGNLSRTSPNRLQDTYVYVKGAFQILAKAKEKPHKTLLKWARKNPDKMQSGIDSYCSQITKALSANAP